jgi:hypothetical protein
MKDFLSKFVITSTVLMVLVVKFLSLYEVLFVCDREEDFDILFNEFLWAIEH